MKYIIYTDGAYSQMNDEGAYAFVILTEHNNEVKRFAKKITHETNNRAELKAIINAVLQLPQDATDIIVNSDSQYALNTLSGKWKRKLNKDLFDIWDDVVKERNLNIEYKWVRGHNGNEYNELCDKLCNEAIGYDANMSADVIHPVFTTMMPKSLCIEGMGQILHEFCCIKNEDYDGEAGLQLSINSTDEEQRKELFRGRSMSLEDIASIARNLPIPKGRKYTLNFPVTDKTILDPKELSRLFDKDKFIVKITPIHETNEANANGINTPEGYYKYDVYRQFEQPLLDEGWDVIVFIPSKEEDEDRITCGNALLSTYNKH